MKHNRNNYFKFMTGTLCALSFSAGFAGGPEPVLVDPPINIYVGIFGGIAGSNSFDVSQYGTAFYPEEVGGPLAVNAFGSIGHETSGLVGANIGYQWGDISGSVWGVVPAIELEGYYLTKASFTADDINNDTTRLPEHDFVVTYPTKTGVFLTNIVLNINTAFLGRFHPYVGVGFGGAIASVSNATATQIAPPEPGVNHFNSNASDTDTTLAAQAKIGLGVNLSESVILFAEYRFLYLSGTNYTFGSTVYPAHPATSSWQIEMDPRHYNIGVLGLQFNF